MLTASRAGTNVSSLIIQLQSRADAKKRTSGTHFSGAYTQNLIPYAVTVQQ